MLEPEITYAELEIKCIKESRKKNKIDYVHPKNDIKDGFIIINYKKRDMEWKELMDGRLRMMVPKDWKLAESKSRIVYQYEGAAEKEKMILIYNKQAVMEDYKAQLRYYEENQKIPLKLTESTEIPYKNTNILCSFLQDEKDTFLCIFFCRMGEGLLQGIFAMHRYRKKPWKHIIPQMLGTMEILTDNIKENENKKKQSVTDRKEQKA